MRKRVGRRVREREEDEMTKEEAARLWEEAQPVEVERRRTESSVLSVRLGRLVFRELVLRARREGKGPATLARELIEEGLARKEGASVSLVAELLVRRLSESGFYSPITVLLTDRPRLTEVAGGVLPESSTMAPEARRRVVTVGRV